MEQFPLINLEEKYTIDRDGNVFGKDKNIPLTTHKRSSTSTTNHITLTRYDGSSVAFSIQELLRLQFSLGEGWDEVIGYEGLYNINRQGEVYSCKYNKIMKNQTDESGYLYVSLHSKGNPKHKGRIHRLLAIQYIPNPENLEQVDHIDRNKLNNDLSNLRWVTQTENRRNRPDLLHLMTPEQEEERIVKLREYKTMKAREYRKTRNETETPEQREERLKKSNAKSLERYHAKKALIDSIEPKLIRPTPLTETPEQRDERWKRNNERNKKSIAKKIAKSV
jgi:hypothetical protein